MRFATNDPTPWPPEVPAGENPPFGALIDYYLATNSSGTVKLDILDGAGKVVRSYSGDERIASPTPATDPDKYNQLCQLNPNAADCGLPLYWPAPSLTLSSQKGMHRFNWDMHYDPIASGGGDRGGDDGSAGAVPHRTYTAVNSPWAPPGAYTVRLTVDGKSVTQPLALRLDPRVKTPVAALTQLAALTKETYAGALTAHGAAIEARSLVTQLSKLTGADVDAFKARVESLAPAPATGGGRGGRGGGGRGAAAPAAALTLESVSRALLESAMAMQSADVAPTAVQIAACRKAKADLGVVMARWNALKSTGLAGLNAKRKAAGQPVVPMN